MITRVLGNLVFRLRALLQRDDAERALLEELEFHRAMDAEALRERGMSPDEAAREASRRFGSVAREAERARDGWGVALSYEFIADVRHALRQMRRRPLFSVVVTLTLGLGIGATIALFSVVSDLLLRPLPYRGPGDVYVFWSDYNWRGEEYDFVRERSGVFDRIGAFSINAGPYRPSVGAGSGVEMLTYAVGTASLLEVLGTPPFIGRHFNATDDRRGAAPVIVVSHGMWRQDLGADPDVIGRQIQLDGQAVTVVGVMPPGFFFPTPEIRAWRPLQLDPASSEYANLGYLTLVARSAATGELVASDVQRIARDLGTRFTYPAAWDKTKGAHATAMRTYLFGEARDPLLLLLAAVAMLLLIACANAAGLILARTSDRTGEMSVRSALGAGRWRLARQIAAESLLLAVVSAGTGVVIAAAGFRVLVARLPLDGFGETVAIGWQTFFAAFALSLLIALLVSAVPVRNILRGGYVGSGLTRERSESGLRGGGGTQRFHGALIAGQVTLAVLLLIGAALLIRSVDRLRALDMGFRSAGVATFTLVAGDGMESPARRQFYRDAVSRVSALPGVTSAGLVNRLPIRDGGFQGTVTVEGRPDLSGPQRPNMLYRTVTPGFFTAMGIRVREGRRVDSTDRGDALPVALVSELFARKMWPGETAIGKHVTSRFSGAVVRQIVGVVSETRLTSVTGEAPFALYVPFEQHEPAIEVAVLVAHTSGPMPAAIAAVRQAMVELNPDVAVARVQTMDEVMSVALAQPLRLRFFLALFAALALTLGAVGIYGIVSYAVARRRAEFASRMALGASPARVLREVLRHGLVPVIVGVGAGIAGALALSGVVNRFLYGVTSTDARSIALALLVILIAGGLAALVPAVRAGHTSPTEALRSD